MDDREVNLDSISPGNNRTRRHRRRRRTIYHSITNGFPREDSSRVRTRSRRRHRRARGRSQRPDDQRTEMQSSNQRQRRHDGDYERRSDGQEQRRNPDRRARSRSLRIGINLLTDCCPPCEPRVSGQADQAARVAKAPCHAKWDTGYNPGPQSRSSFYSQEGSECTSSGSGRRAPYAYRPIVENCGTSSGSESFPTGFAHRFDADRGENQLPTPLSTVNIRLSALTDHRSRQTGGINEESEMDEQNIYEYRQHNMQHDPTDFELESGQEHEPPQPMPRRVNPQHQNDAPQTQRRIEPEPDQQTRQGFGDPAMDWSPDEGVFPFRETASGNLVIKKQQVSLQTPNVAILLADPERLTLRNIRERRVLPPDLTKVAESDELPPPRAAAAAGRMPSLADEDDGQLPKAHAIPRKATLERGYETEPGPTYSSKQYGRRESKASKPLLENLHYRLTKAINPDTKIIIGNKEFPIHGIALQCYSKYADKQRRSKQQILEFHIPEKVMRSSDFPSVMDWILMEDDEKHGVINRENVISLFSAATFLEIPQLQDDCLNFVKYRVDDGDPAILNMYSEAKERDCRYIIPLLASKLAGLFPKIYKSKQFLQMRSRELILLLSADNLVIHSELDVYDAAARWLLFDWEKRGGFTVDIMRTVRFGLLTPLQLTQIRHSAEASSLPNYTEIFALPEVKKLVEDGQTYAILKESYQGRPGELQRWLKKTGVTAPRDRRQIRSVPDPKIPTYSRDENHFGYRKETKQKKPQQKTNSNIPQERGRNSGQRLDERNSTRYEHQDQTNAYPQSSDNMEADEETVEAATLIQSSVRGWLARKRYKKLKKAAIAVQGFYRASQKKVPIKLLGLRSKHSESILLLGGYDTHRPLDDTNSAFSIFKLNVVRNTWELRGHLLRPRVRQGTVQIDNFIYIFGGEDPTKTTSTGKNIKCATTWSLNLNTGEWQELSEMRTPRSYFGYAVLNGKIFVFGGLDDDARPLNSCEVYDPRRNAWNKFRSMDGPRLSPAVAKTGDKIWVVGGFTKMPGNPMLKSTIIYDAKTNQFYMGPELPFTRCNGSLIAYYDQLILLGGATYAGDGKIRSLSDVSHLVQGEWVSVTNLRTGPRHGHCALKVGKYVVIAGGVNSETMFALDQVESFNLEKFRGSTRIANLPLKLSGASGVVVH